MIKKLLLIFLVLIILSLGSFNLTNNQAKISSVQNKELSLTPGKIRLIPPATLPSCFNKDNNQETQINYIPEEIEEIKISGNQIKKPIQTSILAPKAQILASIDWEAKEEEIEEAKRTGSSVSLGMQCGDNTIKPSGVGPLYTANCCTGCCKPCDPGVCCDPCTGCCEPSCEKICECVGGAGNAYLWDSITGICGCGQ